MENTVVQLIEPVKLEKEGLEPIFLDAGTILKIVYSTPTAHLVSTDSGFTFTLPTDQENIAWKSL